MGQFQTLYEMLLVSSRASRETITAKFRKISLLCHPDQGGDTDHFCQLQQAHRILTDKDATTIYDNEGWEAADAVLSEKPNN